MKYCPHSSIYVLQWLSFFPFLRHGMRSEGPRWKLCLDGCQAGLKRFNAVKTKKVWRTQVETVSGLGQRCGVVLRQEFKDSVWTVTCGSNITEFFPKRAEQVTPHNRLSPYKPQILRFEHGGKTLKLYKRDGPLARKPWMKASMPNRTDVPWRRHWIQWNKLTRPRSVHRVGYYHRLYGT